MSYVGRKECTSGHRCEPKTPREALYCAASHSQMTRTELAEAMGINPSALSKWCDPNGDEHIPDERLVHLLALTDDNPTYSKFLAKTQDLIVYDPKSAPRNVTRLVTEFGELLAAIDKASEDGTISAEDADRIEREADDLIGAVRRQVDEANRKAARGPRAITIEEALEVIR